MATLVDYRGLQVVSPNPTGAGGLAIQNDLKSLVEWGPKSVWSQSASPGSSDDSGSEFYPGSLWLRTDTTPPQLFVCRSSAVGAAVWLPVLLNLVQDTAPKLGGDLDVNGHKIVGPVGVNVTPAALGALESRSTSGPQVVASYDGSNYGTISVSSSGVVTINAVGTAPSVAIADPLSVTQSTNAALTSQVQNANGGAGAVAIQKVVADVAQGQLAAYSSGYSGSLASTVMICSTVSAPLLFGINSAEVGRWSTGLNLQFNAGATSPTLAAAAADIVSLCGIDKAAGDRRLYVQSEAGSSISLGNDRLNFAAATGIASIGGSDTLWVTSGKLGIGVTPSDTLHVSGTAQITGHLAIGTTVTTTEAIRLAPTTSGGSVQMGILGAPTFGSDCTSDGFVMLLSGATTAASYTLANLWSIAVGDAVKGAGSTITNLYGVQIADQTQGTNNYGLQSQVSAGTNKWNLFIAGSAKNYVAGSVGLGVSSPLAKLHVVDTTEACRFGYDGSNYWNSAISSTGMVTLTAVGSTPGFTFANPVLVNNPAAGIGYTTGAGGSVTQATSKTTGVTLNKICGRITTSNSSLLSTQYASFVLTNSAIAATDVLVINHVSGGTVGVYTFNAAAGTGSATVTIRNGSLGTLTEALVLQFVVVKASIT
ncbi:MAG: hypothetical protein JWP89_2273 [Schlesneria sp.]|nr:hypothetical protein [Schlesneria sp.]